MNRLTRNSYPGLLCSAVILLLTGIPGTTLRQPPIIGLDKVVHFLMYAVFTFASIWGYRKPFTENGKSYRQKAVGIVIAIGFIYGALTEVMQETLIPGRTGSIYDWIADALGSIFGAIIAIFLLRDRNNLKNEALGK